MPCCCKKGWQIRHAQHEFSSEATEAHAAAFLVTLSNFLFFGAVHTRNGANLRDFFRLPSFAIAVLREPERRTVGSTHHRTSIFPVPVHGHSIGP